MVVLYNMSVAGVRVVEFGLLHSYTAMWDFYYSAEDILVLTPAVTCCVHGSHWK